MFFTKVVIAGGVLCVGASLLKRQPKKKFAWLNEPFLQRTERTGSGEQITDLSSVELSHELRTPLHIMLSHVRSLRDKFDPSAEANHQLHIIEENGHQLLSVITHVLGILRGEQPAPEFQPFMDISYDYDTLATDFSQMLLPESLHACLMEAAKQGELTRLERLINQVQLLGEKETLLADTLFKLTKRIDFTGIVRCLKEVNYA